MVVSTDDRTIDPVKVVLKEKFVPRRDGEEVGGRNWGS
jgi:hypothetical protein